MKLCAGLLAVLGAGVVNALATISTSGNKFFTSDGKQFFLKGIAYQLDEHDPLIDTEQCSRDAALMKTLGANSIRVYHVDAKADHSGCMTEFSKVGIYPMIDLDTFDTYILPDDPWWNQTQYQRYGEVMDAFAKFDNLLGFFIGNEIIAKNNQSMVAPFIKAATRDMKAYRASKGYRDFPIGYAAADIAELRPMLQDYLTCGGNASENIDFFGLNSYEWCQPTDTYLSSGYKNLESMAVNFPVPMFFSETGCIVPRPRLFEDQAAIFGPDMVADWSGSIIYEWIQEANEYGLISYGPQVDPTVTASDIAGGYTRKGQPTPISPDFTNLQKQWATITPSSVASSEYDPKHVSTRTCPMSTSGAWLVNGNVALPALGATLTTGGSYSTVPSATATTSAPASTSKNPASPNREIAGMGTGLVGVMLFFTFWM